MTLQMTPPPDLMPIDEEEESPDHGFGMGHSTDLQSPNFFTSYAGSYCAREPTASVEGEYCNVAAFGAQGYQEHNGKVQRHQVVTPAMIQKGEDRNSSDEEDCTCAHLEDMESGTHGSAACRKLETQNGCGQMRSRQPGGQHYTSHQVALSSFPCPLPAAAAPIAGTGAGDGDGPGYCGVAALSGLVVSPSSSSVSPSVSSTSSSEVHLPAAPNSHPHPHPRPPPPLVNVDVQAKKIALRRFSRKRSTRENYCPTKGSSCTDSSGDAATATTAASRSASDNNNNSSSSGGAWPSASSSSSSKVASVRPRRYKQRARNSSSSSGRTRRPAPNRCLSHCDFGGAETSSPAPTPHASRGPHNRCDSEAQARTSKRMTGAAAPVAAAPVAAACFVGVADEHMSPEQLLNPTLTLLPSPPSTSSTPSPPSSQQQQPAPPSQQPQQKLLHHQYQPTRLSTSGAIPNTPVATAGAAPTSAGTANADCYTCRRRRVKCDRQLPFCAKCNRTKLECLGYKKPLVWNKGVASRGKMMGKTFPTPATPVISTPAPVATPTTARPAPSNTTPTPVVLDSTTAASGTKRKKQWQSPVKVESSNGGTVAQVSSSPVTSLPLTPTTPSNRATVLWSEQALPESGGRITPADEADSSDDHDTVVLPCTPPLNHSDGGTSMALTTTTAGASVPGELAISLQMPTGMGSPFGHLDADSRYYMSYFERRVASDLLLFDRYADNPYRSLLPQAAEHPALLNAILAVSARHNSNVCGHSEARALPYKGRSFQQLSLELQRKPKHILTEPTLAVIMLFLFFETLDGGLDTWKIHLRGARRLIQLCAAHAPETAAASSMLRIFTSHVTLIDIIGRTLSSSSSEPLGSTPETFRALREGEAYNFLGCPTDLLEILHTITILKSKPPQEDYLATCQALLRRIDDFSPQIYIRTRPGASADDPPQLVHLVAAYKFASRIYAMETLFPNIATRDAVALYHADLRAELSALPAGTFLMKGSFWPLFVAGTGAVTQGEREWVRARLRDLWDVLPQWNVRNAGGILEHVWKEGGGEGWSEVLRKRGGDWLFL